MKIDQLNNFTSDRVNDILESRFGARIDLSDETLETLTVFQEAIRRELDEMTANIGFNKSMQNPKFVENRLVFDLIANAIKEKKGKDHDGDGDIDSDDYLKSRDIAIKKAMGKKVDDKDKKEDAKVKMVRGNKIDIEDPDKPGQTTTIDTTKADVDVDDAGEITIDNDKKAGAPSKNKIRPGQTVKMEDDDIEDMVAPEFEEIIHMLKQGMSADEIKKKHPDHADTVDQVVKDLQAVTEAMNSMLDEALSGTEQSALRLLVGTKEFMTWFKD